MKEAISHWSGDGCSYIRIYICKNQTKPKNNLPAQKKKTQNPTKNHPNAKPNRIPKLKPMFNSVAATVLPARNSSDVSISNPKSLTTRHPYVPSSFWVGFWICTFPTVSRITLHNIQGKTRVATVGQTQLNLLAEITETAANLLFRVSYSRPVHAVTVLPPLMTKVSSKRYMHGRFFRCPPSTKLCPSCSPLEDSEFATTNQNPSREAAWINQTTTIKSIRLGKKSISPEQVCFQQDWEVHRCTV